MKKKYRDLLAEKQAGHANQAAKHAAQEHARQAVSKAEEGGVSKAVGSSSILGYMTPRPAAQQTPAANLITNHLQPRSTGKDEIDDALTEAFLDGGLAFTVVESASFKNFVDKLQAGPKSYRLPTRKTLGGKLLDRAYDRATAYTEAGIFSHLPSVLRAWPRRRSRLRLRGGLGQAPTTERLSARLGVTVASSHKRGETSLTR